VSKRLPLYLPPPNLCSLNDGVRAAVRVAQVTTCADWSHGGNMYDPCTGSSGPGYYNRRLRQ